MLYTLMPSGWGCHDREMGMGGLMVQGGDWWSVTIVSIQGHRLERLLLVKPAARAWVEEHVTRERSSSGDLGRKA